ncbi:MAG: aminotransferase class V-fold PLP-dependent enzyme [Clostridia bacterium]
MIYLDNAATSFPKPKAVLDKSFLVQQSIAANPGRSGHEMSLKASDLIFDTRMKLAQKFNCEPDRVIFTSNCTQSINMAVYGMVKQNEHVIISSLEHNSVFRPVHRLKLGGQISYDVAKVDPLSDETTLSSFEKLIKPNTKFIICTHASNVFGTVLPIEKIGKLAKKHSLKFIVDAAQSAGAIEIDMQKCFIDALCMPAHKGLFAPMGLGILLLNKTATVEPLIVGGTGSNSLSDTQPEFYPDRLESGTMNLSAIAGLNAGLEFIDSYGGDKAIHEKEIELCEILKEDLSVIKNATLYDQMHGNIFSPVVAFNLGTTHSEEVAQALYEKDFVIRAGFQCASLAHNSYNTTKSGVVRVSAGVFNNKKDIKNLIFYINKIAN